MTTKQLAAIALAIFALTLPAAAATGNIVPRTTNSATLGTSAKPWGTVYGSNFVAGGTFTGSGAGLTGIPGDAIVGGVSGASVDAGGVPYTGELDLSLADGHRGVVHPNFVNLKTNWNGAQYWLAITGAGTNTALPNKWFEANEQVHVFSSADMVNWTPRGAQPIITQSNAVALAGLYSNGWCADPEIYLAPDGVMRILYGVFAVSVTTPCAGFVSNAVMLASSADGSNWTHQVLHYGPLGTNTVHPGAGTNASFAGPQIVTDHTGELRLYFVDDGLNTHRTNVLKYVPAMPGDTSGTNWNWTAEVPCTFRPYQTNISAPWHFSMNYAGGIYHLVSFSQDKSNGEYSTSTNGVNFSDGGFGVFSDLELLNKGTANEFSFYKAALRPVAGANGITWDGLVNARPENIDNADGWRLKLVRGLKLDTRKLSYLSGNTNITIIGGENSGAMAGSTRRAALTIVDQSTNGNQGQLNLGRTGTGSAGFGIGNYDLTEATATLYGDANSYTILRAPNAAGILEFRQAATTRAGIEAIGGGWFVGTRPSNAVPAGSILATSFIGQRGATNFTGDGAGLTNLISNQLTNPATANAHLTISTNGRVTVGFSDASPVEMFEVRKTVDYTPSANTYGIRSTITLDHPSNTGRQYAALLGEEIISPSSSVNYDVVRGVYGITSHKGSGYLSAGYSFFGASSAQAGTVGTLFGYRSGFSLSGTATANYAKHFYATDLAGTATNTVERQYGVFLEPMTAGTVQNFGIFSLGGSNYLADSVGIGTSNALSKIDIQGDARVREGLTVSNYATFHLLTNKNFIVTSNGTAIFTLDTGGHVGIGKAPSSAGLDVNGNIISSSTVSAGTVGAGIFRGGNNAAFTVGSATTPSITVQSTNIYIAGTTVFSNTVTASNYTRFVPTNVITGSSIVTNIAAGNYPFGAFGCLMAEYTNTVTLPGTGVYTNIASGAAYTRVLTNGFAGSTTAGTLTPYSDGYYGVQLGATVFSTVGLNGDELEIELFVSGSGQEYFAGHNTCGPADSYTQLLANGVMFLRAGQACELRIKNISGTDAPRLIHSYLRIGAP